MSDDNKEDRYAGKIEKLLVKYFAYFDTCSWPAVNEDGWDEIARDWTSAFGEHRYSPKRVENAMSKIKRDPPKWKQDHLPCLLKLMAEDGSTGPQDPLPSLEDCPRCEGSGWATIYRADYRGEEMIIVNDPINNKSRRVCLRITAPCTCNLGRRAYSSCQEKRTKVVDALSLTSGWSFDEPHWTATGRGMA